MTRLLHRLTPLVEPAADPALATFLREAQAARRKIGTMEELLQKIPELQELLIDCTEQQRTRPAGKRRSKRYFSGYKHRHTLKTEITVVPTGRILHVSETYPGSVQDRAVYHREHLASLIPTKTAQYLDLGYEGLKKTFPKHDFRLPHKRHTRRGGLREPAPPLTRGQKQANALRKKRRLPVEHVFARLKSFRILSGVWRCSEEIYNDTFRSIAALSNFKRQWATG